MIYCEARAQYAKQCNDEAIAMTIGRINEELDTRAGVSVLYMCDYHAEDIARGLIPSLLISTGEFLYLGCFDSKTDNEIRRAYGR